jgi:hypothetical protein
VAIRKLLKGVRGLFAPEHPSWDAIPHSRATVVSSNPRTGVVTYAIEVPHGHGVRVYQGKVAKGKRQVKVLKVADARGTKSSLKALLTKKGYLGASQIGFYGPGAKKKFRTERKVRQKPVQIVVEEACP